MNQTKQDTDATLSLLNALTAYLNVTIGLVAAIGCLTVLFFMPFAKLAKNLKVLICVLSFADFGAVVEICFVEALVSTLFPATPTMGGNVALCQLHNFLMDTFEVLSQLLATILAIERCHAVCSPFSARQMTDRVTVLAVVSAFIAAILITVPHFLFYTITPGNVCTSHIPDDPGKAATYVIVRHVLVEHGVFPLVIIVCNIVVLAILTRRSRVHSQMHRTNKNNNLRVTVALVVIGMMHALFLTPCGVFCYMMFVLSTSPLAPFMWQYAKLAYVVFALARGLNVVIYAATIDSFASVIKSPPCCSSSKVNRISRIAWITK